ncbi:hypothetical protein L249_1422 [Ophiocordyceps polyrhachis-furcata BCC 54312]|uniref:Uncharacterized protein n=1 Tax=Ophiocordyceps polyrhachis-furcata BCC 54312 TaxID=1330021 RepID=A0A367L483_9HYPO|nr:hypothetical protein L249_1422 [Ophiocordyceps polyrhachis-furcata BCC 54312]
MSIQIAGQDGDIVWLLGPAAYLLSNCHPEIVCHMAPCIHSPLTEEKGLSVTHYVAPTASVYGEHKQGPTTRTSAGETRDRAFRYAEIYSIEKTPNRDTKVAKGRALSDPHVSNAVNLVAAIFGGPPVAQMHIPTDEVDPSPPGLCGVGREFSNGFLAEPGGETVGPEHSPDNALSQDG